MEDLVGTKQKMRQGADRGLEGGGPIRPPAQLRCSCKQQGEGAPHCCQKNVWILYGIFETIISNRNDGEKNKKG